MKKSLIVICVLFLFVSNISAQKWGVNASAGYSFTVGEFSDYYNNGFHGSAAGFYNLTNGAQVSLITGYSRWSLNGDFFNEKWAEQNPLQTVDVEAPVTAIPLLIGFKYYINLSRKVKPYFLFAGGINFLTTELSGTLDFYTPDGHKIRTEEIKREKESFTETTIGLGLGVAFKLNKKMWLDFDWKYNLMNDSKAIQSPENDPTDSTIKERTLSYISFMVGIDYTF